MTSLGNRIEIMKGLHIKQHGRNLAVRLLPPPADKLGLVQSEYKYKAEDSPKYPGPQVDAVLEQIQTEIEALNFNNMYFSASEVFVAAATNSPPLWPPSPGVGRKLYLFHINAGWFDEFPVAMPVKLADKMEELTAESILIQIPKAGWKPLREALLTMPDREYLSRDNDAMIRTQQVWWKQRKLPFRFLDLPEEIHLQVYEQALADTADQEPRTIGRVPALDLALRGSATATPRITMGRYYEPRHPRTIYQVSDDLGRGPNYALLRVSKEVSAGALYASAYMWKYFRDLVKLSKILEYPQLLTGTNWLNKLVLSMTYGEWFELFGVDITPRLQVIPKNSKGSILQNIPSLQHLRIHFSTADNLHTPWSEWRLSQRNVYGWITDPVIDSMKTKGCSRSVQDMILRLAYEYIKDIPFVSISGAIKTGLRIYWEDILRTGHHDLNKALPYDWKKGVEELKDMKLEAPICQCTLPCDGDVQFPGKPKKRDWEARQVFFRVARDFDHDGQITKTIINRVRKLTNRHPDLPTDIIIPLGRDANVEFLQLEWRNMTAAEKKSYEDMILERTGRW